MCEFCKSLKNKCGLDILSSTEVNFGILGKGNLNLEVSQSDNIYISACIDFGEDGGGTEYTSVEVNYCPMCGRKLTDEENPVETKPVIRAHAIIDWLGNPKCSNCGDTGINASEPYCQHCGARLDEPEERIVV